MINNEITVLLPINNKEDFDELNKLIESRGCPKLSDNCFNLIMDFNQRFTNEQHSYLEITLDLKQHKITNFLDVDASKGYLSLDQFKDDLKGFIEFYERHY